MSTNMNMDDFSFMQTTKVAGFDSDEASDFASFFNDGHFSVTPSTGVDFTTSVLPFATGEGGVTDPILSPLDASFSAPSSTSSNPFDFDFNSSPVDFTPATPDLMFDDQDLPSLFATLSSASASSAAKSLPAWSPTDVGAPTSSLGNISPSMMSVSSPLVSPSLESFTQTSASGSPFVGGSPLLDFSSMMPMVDPIVTAAATEAPREIKPLPAKTAASGGKKKGSPAASGAGKVDKHTGTRNTKIPPIPMEAPTMSRTYLIPAVTGRKRAPAAITAKLAPAVGAKKAKTASSSKETGIDVGEEGLNPDELPEELLNAIEEKRRSNTLAARQSRMRKANHLATLTARAEGLESEVEAWKKKCSELEEVIRALRGC